VAAWVPDMLCNFYIVKSHKFDDNSLTTEARVKIGTYLESLDHILLGIVRTIFIENDAEILPCTILGR
jgi:hypothetical protein